MAFVLAVNNFVKSSDDGECYGKTKKGIKGGGSTERYPRSVQVFPSDKQKVKLHPTQKPLDLITSNCSTLQF
jgi:site-specific DNA-methyltransferase (adenine-specific)